MKAAHEDAANFDASPFGKIKVTGPDAEALPLKTCAGHVGRAPGSVIFTAVLNGQGTFESDIAAQRTAGDYYRLFTGTAAIKRDLAWFRRHAEGFNASLEDNTGTYAILGLMGREAARIAAEINAPELNELGYFRVGPAFIAGKHVRAAGLSHVGEAGWETTCLPEKCTGHLCGADGYRGETGRPFCPDVHADRKGLLRHGP